MQEKIPLPSLLAGPILRRVDAKNMSVWLVTSSAQTLNLSVSDGNSPVEGTTDQKSVQIGLHAHIQLLSFIPEQKITANHEYHYDVLTTDRSSLCSEAYLHYDEKPLHFRWQQHLTHVAHGSCRKPHYPGDDALVALDAQFTRADGIENEFRPDVLLLSGDQVYVDDVAGPMLNAIHQVIDMLGLYEESLEGATLSCSSELKHKQDLLYKRETLLPKFEHNDTLLDTFFGAKEKPIFTSVNAKNHLISLAEMLAMYLLVWSPKCWDFVNLSNDIQEQKHHLLFNQELEQINHFKQGLPKVQRVLAHIPTYMIFDDHDVTDDWNLTRGWEEIVYGHPFSKRVIGNALIAYWLCQGWGNEPEKFESIYTNADKVFEPQLPKQNQLIDQLLSWENWCFCLDTEPFVYVMDSRTRRWRSESNKNKPSGLLDWEALCEFQNTIMNKQRVIVVSPAPIFGVKLIEAIQKVFTFFGKALTVDAENWMAHKGTANVMLNIFKHTHTPPQFIILSGDVHYNFVYDISIKHRRNSPNIVQFTASGIKNEFPATLLAILDKINQLLYASRSPLNWFTKRRRMKIKTRRPNTNNKRSLLNTPAIGVVKISSHSDQVSCELLTAKGECIRFEQEQ
ncbi:alkaline phosphatase family protein [Alteromonas sp. 5E99-2]|uniref:alkaline phosphatase family protein n=1 Tax=Alteromonas sp. 5E99-2 TaxID=2817683 RepID=UPI001A9861D0|nr:alkaline phosphatase family protein [Alteromonas sp. 5E99-2]MBO1254519.1 alkaline phosphatase family protein [Alteromonas sp. 5E99-2]